jgi:hypothetical protein
MSSYRFSTVNPWSWTSSVHTIPHIQITELLILTLSWCISRPIQIHLPVVVGTTWALCVLSLHLWTFKLLCLLLLARFMWSGRMGLCEIGRPFCAVFIEFFLDSFHDAVARIFHVTIFTSIVDIAATCLVVVCCWMRGWLLPNRWIASWFMLHCTGVANELQLKFWVTSGLLRRCPNPKFFLVENEDVNDFFLNFKWGCT